MKITVTDSPLEAISAEALVVLHEETGMLGMSNHEPLADHLLGFASAVAAHKSKREWFCTLPPAEGVKTRHLLMDSVTFDAKAPHDEPLKIAAARAVATCRDHSVRKICFAAHHRLAAAKAAAMLEGAMLGDFSDRRFKGAKAAEARAQLEVIFAVPKEAKKEVTELLKRTEVVCEGVNAARELVNAPHHVVTPAALATYARQLASRLKIKCQVLDEKALVKQGYRLTWEVGRGSEYPPRLIVLQYIPQRRVVAEHIGLIGKGITFDTGGLCIKTKDSIFKMNNDMGGAAAVLGAMEAAVRLKVPARITAVIAAAHNAVDGAAFTPGCIVTARNGKTVFIENTDAEGRLVLADAFSRAGDEKVDLMVDVATLTGACVAALGPSMAGLFTDDEELRTQLMTAAGNTGDGLWPLPLVREYESSLNHHLADMQNMSSIRSGGGAIHAANFLKAFVPPGVRWAHLDIAGMAALEKNWRYYRTGATGFGVRLLVELLRLLQETASGSKQRPQ